MLTAEKKSALGRRYQINADGQPVAVWDPSWWRTGGEFEIDGHRFTVRSSTFGTKYRMVDEAGNDVALVEKAGRKHWSVQADGRTYEFRRAARWGNRQELISAGLKVGSLHRTSAWSGSIEADLPGMPLPVQVFVVAVQIAIWQAQQSSSAG